MDISDWERHGHEKEGTQLFLSRLTKLEKLLRSKDIKLMELLDVTDQAWGNFKSALDQLKSQHIPVKKMESSKSKWGTRETTKCGRAKEKAWKKLRILKNDESYSQYRHKLNDANRANGLPRNRRIWNKRKRNRRTRNRRT